MTPHEPHGASPSLSTTPQTRPTALQRHASAVPPPQQRPAPSRTLPQIIDLHLIDRGWLRPMAAQAASAAVARRPPGLQHPAPSSRLAPHHSQPRHTSAGLGCRFSGAARVQLATAHQPSHPRAGHHAQHVPPPDAPPSHSRSPMWLPAQMNDVPRDLSQSVSQVQR